MRTAFKIANKATPTSAKTASHIVAKPPAPSTKTIASVQELDLLLCLV